MVVKRGGRERDVRGGGDTFKYIYYDIIFNFIIICILVSKNKDTKRPRSTTNNNEDVKRSNSYQNELKLLQKHNIIFNFIII